ncbi:MAG: MCE family protein [Actinomycetota bacterium]|nr:MCE family protein [Actinomycetota bacterium]
MQFIAFIVIAVTSLVVMAVGYVGLPQMLFGIGQYRVTVELPAAGGLYQQANVTYRGSKVGRVAAVRLTNSGVVADLDLDSAVKIPSDLEAAVHSQSAVGEQYVALIPRNGAAPPLKDGDVIPLARTSVPPNMNDLLDATNRALHAIPGDNVKVVLGEAYTAIGGLGPELSRLVNGAARLATDARAHQDELTSLIDTAPEVLASQSDTSDAIQGWTSHVASITSQLQRHDESLRAILDVGPSTADEARQLVDRLSPTLPVVLTNLISVADVALVYQANIEQLLVLVPQGVANLQGTAMANLNTKQAYKGIYLSFNTNVNLPPICNTGFLPAQQRRSPSFEDAPDRPAGDLYCRIPQESPWHVRGARNLPCATKPGKRAPTVAMCESDEVYVPLNDGLNWKGDPNATLSGQGVPQLPSAAVPPPEAQPVPALAVAEYEPSSGTYVGPDGNTYTQSDLGEASRTDQSWQSMLIAPGS